RLRPDRPGARASPGRAPRRSRPRRRRGLVPDAHRARAPGQGRQGLTDQSRPGRRYLGIGARRYRRNSLLSAVGIRYVCDMRFTNRAGRTLALLALTGSAVALLPTTAPADTLSTFDARAAASGVDVTIANGSIPLGLVVQGTAPVARAALDSLGTSEALAAGPYPGDLAASLPGTVKTTSGIPLPDYPFVAATSAGDDPKEVVAPGVSLRAESRAQRSASRATVGSDSTGSTSTADAEHDDTGGAQATAVARTDALDAAGLVVSVPATTPKGGLPDLPPLVSGQPALPKPPPSEPAPLPAG